MSAVVENQRISIAEATVAAHGVSADVPKVYDPVFTKKNEVYPTPDGDAYLSVAGLVASERGGTTITVETPPGYVDHMREIGVLPDDTTVIQRPVTITNPDKIGHPASDPLALMVRDGHRFDTDGQRPLYVSIFESPEVRKEAAAAGLELLGRPDSTLTNNKARLRQFAAQYGIDMLPGKVVETWDDLHRFADQHKDETAWMKVSIGSGGDLVLKVNETSRESVDEATKRMRATVAQAFERADFSMPLEEFWPKDAVSPVGIPNVIEEDAGVEGKIVVNGSNFFITNVDGSVQYLGTFKQITDLETGEFMGSRLYHPEPAIMEKILEQTMRFAEYNMKENGYYGIQGMDFFVMRDQHGKPRVRPIEGNSRPPISSYPEILMRNLRSELDGYDSQAGTWDNINLVSDRPIDADTKIPDLIGTDLAFGVRDAKGNVLRQAIPLAVRSLVYKNGHEPELVPSDRAKWFVYGSDAEQKALAFKELAARGIVFKAA